MSYRVLDVLNRYLTINGPRGRARVEKMMGIHRTTLFRWRRDGIPKEHEAYRLALACGCTEDEALALACEQPQEAKRA
jgi:hypothetical protein